MKLKAKIEQKVATIEENDSIWLDKVADAVKDAVERVKAWYAKKTLAERKWELREVLERIEKYKEELVLMDFEHLERKGFLGDMGTEMKHLIYWSREKRVLARLIKKLEQMESRMFGIEARLANIKVERAFLGNLVKKFEKRKLKKDYSFRSIIQEKNALEICRKYAYLSVFKWASRLEDGKLTQRQFFALLSLVERCLAKMDNERYDLEEEKKGILSVMKDLEELLMEECDYILRKQEERFGKEMDWFLLRIEEIEDGIKHEIESVEKVEFVNRLRNKLSR